jgi:hypothetical protein
MTDLTQVAAVTPADLVAWFEMKKQLSDLTAAEAMMRRRIFGHYFKTPEEGVNTVPLNDGTGAVIKGTQPINRKVDEGELEALKLAIKAEGSNLPKLPMSKLIKYVPELALKEYRGLTAEERQTFDRCLVIKPGMPALEITIPKRGA